jgi:hypothetical protein
MRSGRRVESFNLSKQFKKALDDFKAKTMQGRSTDENRAAQAADQSSLQEHYSPIPSPPAAIVGPEFVKVSVA